MNIGGNSGEQVKASNSSSNTTADNEAGNSGNTDNRDVDMLDSGNSGGNTDNRDVNMADNSDAGVVSNDSNNNNTTNSDKVDFNESVYKYSESFLSHDKSVRNELEEDKVNVRYELLDAEDDLAEVSQGALSVVEANLRKPAGSIGKMEENKALHVKSLVYNTPEAQQAIDEVNDENYAANLITSNRITARWNREAITTLLADTNLTDEEKEFLRGLSEDNKAVLMKLGGLGEAAANIDGREKIADQNKEGYYSNLNSELDKLCGPKDSTQVPAERARLEGLIKADKLTTENSSNNSRGSLVDDFANPTSEMPSYMDPED